MKQELPGSCSTGLIPKLGLGCCMEGTAIKAEDGAAAVGLAERERPAVSAAGAASGAAAGTATGVSAAPTHSAGLARD